MSTKEEQLTRKNIALNRKARHEYFIEETIEAGIMLQGSEVKSLRSGNVNISDSYANEKQGEIYLLQLHIGEYKGANIWGHKPTRPRKLLLHRRQINKLIGLLKIKGYTIIPLAMYFNHKNIAKIELGLAKGKKQYDKRESEKKRDWEREKSRMMKNS